VLTCCHEIKPVQQETSSNPCSKVLGLFENMEGKEENPSETLKVWVGLQVMKACQCFQSPPHKITNYFNISKKSIDTS
jgi:hypothetical protein